MATSSRKSGLPRHPRLRPGMKALKRSDSLLILLVIILATLTMGFFNGKVEPLQAAPADEPRLLAVPASEGDSSATPLPGTTPRPSATPLPLPSATPRAKAGAPVRFYMHNVANYFVRGEQQRSRYIQKLKTEPAKEAVAELIADTQPDIVGLIEIGGPVALQDLRQRLAARGLDYPHHFVLTRQGEDRALALLSRYPIAENNSRPDVKLYNEQRRKMLRGILDVTIELPDGRRFRIMGAHLKSRVAADPAAATALRNKEAHTLAMHLQDAMRREPGMPILVYGDWNDGPDDSSVRTLRQGLSKDAALTRLKPADSREEYWTLFYDDGSEYCTFDQIYVNKVLSKRMGRKYQSGIVDHPATKTASDHRALWCEMK